MIQYVEMTIHYGAAQGLWDNLTDTMGPDSYRQMIGPPKAELKLFQVYSAHPPGFWHVFSKNYKKMLKFIKKYILNPRDPKPLEK